MAFFVGAFVVREPMDEKREGRQASGGRKRKRLALWRSRKRKR
jgi:hypothetical protein